MSNDTSSEKTDIKKETKMIQILNKDPLKDYSISGMTVESIKNKYMKKETFHNIYIIERDNALHIHECLKLKDIIFVNPIQIDYKIINDVEEKTVSDKNVHSTTQIDATLKNIKAAKVLFYTEKDKYSYFENKHRIDATKKLTIYYAINPYKFTENKDLLKINEEKISKEKLSKYFNEYFKYDIAKKETLFNYYKSESRKDL